ncbi:site-specific integrase [Streptomyces olivochromogenes]|uniref:Site-specific integrase n=1 Tax=Streptomyces olivochromogenes TaxID=1963 RepID=A0A250VFZ0_STROL|nr:site-specific integrase [Streptomyces olivochromogenes]KUN44372.1 integrase [Streptomyces olivochromogenes]GAX53107.1 site-specific integrase [Streptomyces olivochromogenes]
MTETPKRARRAGHGEDTIYWDPAKNRFVGAVSLGHAPNGKRRRPKVYGKTKTEVRTKIRDLKKEMQTGVKSPANYTVAEAVNDWLERGLKGRDDQTVSKNRTLANKHLIPLIGKAKLKDLSADDVDDWLDDRAEWLATRSLRDLLAVLRRSIQHAQRRDKAVRNVALLVTVPEGRPGRPSKALNLEQAKAVLAAARGSRLYAYLVVSLLSGVRTEEARPLTWDHVYLSPQEGVPPHVAVWRSVRKHGETKTRKSRRTIALPKQVVEVLEEHLRWQKQERASKGMEWSPAGRVFTTRSGEPLDAANVRRDFKAIVKKAGLEPEWTPRELRHSFVSLLSDHGIPLERIALLVGHSSQATTEAVYWKQLRPVITEGAEAMDEIFADDDGVADALGA